MKRILSIFLVLFILSNTSYAKDFIVSCEGYIDQNTRSIYNNKTKRKTFYEDYRITVVNNKIIMVYIEESSHWYGKIGFYSDRSNLEVVGNGEILKIRQWNKDLNKQEIISHSNNIENIGLDSLDQENYLNFDFSLKDTSNIRFSTLENRNTQWHVKNNAFGKEEYLPLCKVTSDLIKDDIFTPITILTKNKNIKFDEANYENKVTFITCFQLIQI